MWVYKVLSLVLFININHAYHLPGCGQVQIPACAPAAKYGCACKEGICPGNQTDLFISNCKRDPGVEIMSALQAKWDVQALELDGTKLKTIPEFVCSNMTHLEYLKITNNSIASVPEICFRNLQSLKHLVLQNNHIEKVIYGHFGSLPELDFLDLSNNLINSISLETWISINESKLTTVKVNGNKLNEKGLTSIREVPFPTTLKLHLYDNPFECDCESAWIKKWIIKNSDILQNVSNIKCTNLVTGKTQVIIDIENDEDVFLCPSPVPAEFNTVNQLAIAFVLVIIILPVILVLVCLVLYKTRLSVFEHTTWHPFDRDECDGDNKEYDVYISCSHDNEEWVHNYLMQFLKTSSYKVTSYREHLTSGHSLYDNIGASIEKSKRTMCILSKKFIDNEICMFELNYSLNMDVKHKRKRTVIVTSGDFDMVQLDRNIQVNIKKYNFTQKDSSNFKNSLLYFLPVNKLGESQASDFTKTVDECFAVDVPQEVPMYDYF